MLYLHCACYQHVVLLSNYCLYCTFLVVLLSNYIIQSMYPVCMYVGTIENSIHVCKSLERIGPHKGAGDGY